jgi:hypothetical protein
VENETMKKEDRRKGKKKKEGRIKNEKRENIEGKR